MIQSRTPHGESRPAGQSAQNLTEVQAPAAQFTVPATKPPPKQEAPSAIAGEASDAPGHSFADNAGFDLAEIVRMTPEELQQQLAREPSPVPGEIVQALLFLRRRERDKGQAKAEDTSDELRASVEKANHALNDYERALRPGKSTARRAHLSISLSFALGALSSALHSEKAMRAYGNLIRGARKPRALSAPWQAVYDDFRQRGGRQTLPQAFTAYTKAKGPGVKESFRTSYYKKRNAWLSKV